MNELPLISLNGIEYIYENGTKALDNVNLNIYKSEIIGIMGMNGAGKTTLIRTLNGLIRPTKGTILINGENIKSKTVAQLSQKVGLIFQNPHHQLFSNSVTDEIQFSLKNLDIKKNEFQEKVNEILEEFNLKRFEERSPLNLSGGETKKLAMATIMCRDPDIIVFDEPTLGQDGSEIKFFVELIEKEKKAGKTIIIVTHNIEFAMEFIPRTILMMNGNIIADGPTSKVLTNPKLVEQASLVLPQITQFCAALAANGIACDPNLHTRNDLKRFLMKFFENKQGQLKGENN